MNIYYGITRSDEYLAHYGVRGMRWGVRKYIDKNGNVLKRANSFYGKNPDKIASPRKMSRDYNRLNKMYADANAEAIDIKRGTESKIPAYPYTAGMKKMSKNQKLKIYQGQMSGMKDVQSMILNTAKNREYSISLKPKKYLGKSIRDIQGIDAVSTSAENATDIQKYYNGYKAKIRHSDLEDPNSLAHYGIKGMKWGVRKFTDDNTGKANKKFESLYGKNATKKVSKRKMQRHYNALDQSRANINQRMRGDFENFNAKTAYHLAMKNSNSPYYDVEKEEAKYIESSKKDIDKFGEKKIQLENIKKMQEAIVKAANKNGYDGHYTSIKRSGRVGIPTDFYGSKVKYKKAIGHKPINTTYINLRAKAISHKPVNTTHINLRAKTIKIKHDDLNNPNFLAHYGIKGMKWGVRKARYYGNDKALERHYRKAAKKLAKLEDIGNNPKKYAAKATAYGVAAAGTGTLAIGGPTLTAKMLSKIASRIKSEKLGQAAQDLGTWGNKETTVHMFGPENQAGEKEWLGMKIEKPNSKYFKLGAAAVTAGLAAKAGQNAYRAANAKKYRAKAADFRSAMDESFRGTKYEGLNGVPLPPKRRKVRRNSK